MLCAFSSKRTLLRLFLIHLEIDQNHIQDIISFILGFSCWIFSQNLTIVTYIYTFILPYLQDARKMEKFVNNLMRHMASKESN